jgi:hypothetical protein
MNNKSRNGKIGRSPTKKNPLCSERVLKDWETERLRGVFLDAALTPGGALLEHLVLDRRLLEEGPAAEFLQNTGALILLLKAA